MVHWGCAGDYIQTVCNDLLLVWGLWGAAQMPSLPPSSFSRVAEQTDRGRPVAAIHTPKERNATMKITPTAVVVALGGAMRAAQTGIRVGGSAHILAPPVKTAPAAPPNTHQRAEPKP